MDAPGGNAVGWNPDGVTNTFIITEPASAAFNTAFITAEAQTFANTVNYFCDMVFQTTGQFTVTCATPPPYILKSAQIS